MKPETRYARSGDVNIAYQVVGDGPIDVIAIPGYVSHLDMWWDAPTDQLLRRLTSFSRLILFDKRGMGLSDRPAHIDINQWVDDAVAVLDAVGSERAVIFGISAGGPTAMLFTAQHPARARALILYGGYARFVRGDDYEFGFERSAVSSFIGHALANWGTGVGISVLAPSRAKDADAKQYWARLQTISASPAAAATFLRALSEIDIRDVLPSIRVPTLILHPQRDMSVPIEAARLMHGLIAGSALVELDSDVHLIWLSDVIDEIADEIETFVGAAADVSDTGDTIVVTVLAIDPPMAGEDMAAMDAVVRRHGGHPLGIGNRAAFDSPASAIRCGLALVSHTGPHGGRLAIGIHTGQCEVTEDGPGGIAVDLAGQLAVGAQPGQLLVSQTVRDLIIGSPVTLEPRGKRLFAGIQGEWELFEIGGPALAPAPERSVAG